MPAVPKMFVQGAFAHVVLKAYRALTTASEYDKTDVIISTPRLMKETLDDYEPVNETEQD